MTTLADAAAPARARLLTRPLMVRFVSVIGTATSFYDRVPESAYGASSALWNLAYDGGMGLGAAGFGVLALHTGYPVAFVLVAAILAAAVLPAVLPAVTRARAADRSD